MPAMGRTVEALVSSGHRCPVIVGGAPVTGAYAAKIGADGYGEDAPGAVKSVRDLTAAG